MLRAVAFGESGRKKCSFDSSVLQSNVRSFYILNDCTVNYPLSLVVDMQVCGIWEQLWCRNPGLLVWTSGVSFCLWPRKNLQDIVETWWLLEAFQRRQRGRPCVVLEEVRGTVCCGEMGF